MQQQLKVTCSSEQAGRVFDMFATFSKAETRQIHNNATAPRLVYPYLSKSFHASGTVKEHWKPVLAVGFALAMRRQSLISGSL